MTTPFAATTAMTASRAVRATTTSIGGLGEDVLTDSFGDDVLMGGDGGDALLARARAWT